MVTPPALPPSVLIDQDFRENELMRKVFDAQDGQKTVHNDLIDTLVPDDSSPGIIIGQLVIGLALGLFVICFQK